MAAPSADIMSSPDPLNDSATAAELFPSSQRVTRSQRSNRFVSLASSPRKQRFELEVGHNNSPQKLLVTVETENDGTLDGTRRRLFSPASPGSALRRGEKLAATTTTVPLNDAAGGDGAPTTPKRRGRPRKSNGTPIPSAGVKRKSNGTPIPSAKTRRRAGTPVKGTPRRARTPKAGGSEDPLSEASAQPTPRSGRRGRPPKDPPVEPPSDAASASSQVGGSTKRGRRRRQAAVPEEILQLADEAAEFAAIDDDGVPAAGDDAPAPSDALPDENDVTLVPAPSETSEEEGAGGATPRPVEDPVSDIWMTTLSNEPTPRAADRSRQRQSPGRHNRDVNNPLQADIGMTQPEDHGGFIPAPSDISSGDDAPLEPTRRNDTIAQGEDFSMIHMDSLPSFQVELGNTALDQATNEFGEETNMIINNTLESFRQSVAAQEASEDASMQEIHETEAAEPALLEEDPIQTSPASNASPHRMLSSRMSRSPRKGDSSPLRRRVLEVQARQFDDGPDDLHQTRMAPPRRRSSGRFADDDSNLYDDSFSEIPEDVLEAATPRRPAFTNPDSDVEEDDEQRAEEQQLHKSAKATDDLQPQRPPAYLVEGDVVETAQGNAASTSASTGVRSEIGRLPTPDDTPPYDETEEVETQLKSAELSQVSQASSQVGDQEPYRNQTEVVEAASHGFRAIERSKLSVAPLRQSKEVTPIHQMSSPVERPQSLQAETVVGRPVRPTLSPIMRAGRVLQNITSDPPSPEGREKQLGSPFRSSASRESWSGSKNSQNGRRISMSPSRPLVATAAVQSSPAVHRSAAGRASEDPFRSSPGTQGQASFMEALNKSRTSLVEDTGPVPQDSSASSMRVTPADEEMSWVANEGPISPNLRGDNTLKEASRSSPAARTRHSAVRSQVDGPDEDRDELAQDEETDIWEFEASRATPRSSRQEPFGRKVAPVFRRGAIPSPWKAKSPRPVAAGALSTEQPDAGSEAEVSEERPSNESLLLGAERSREEEYSMLAQKQATDEAEKEPEPAPSTKPGRFDLSSFFSSPAAIPGKLASKFLPLSLLGSKTNEPEPELEPEPTAAEPTQTMMTSSMFPQALPRDARPRRKGKVGKVVQSPAHANRSNEGQAEPGSSSPATPDRLEMPTIAQKKNFTPRQRQSSQTFHQPGSTTRPSTHTTPPRMQLSHEDIERWQQETSNVSEETPDFRRPLLRPLPPKNASPTKSSLRSPLKPHTPGRVVEFTSSVLSPVEQAIARQQQQQHQQLLLEQSRILNSTPPQALPSAAVPRQPTQVHTVEVDKENHDLSDISMTDASPIAKSPQPLALSQHVWTRQHWLFMDELLQLRRQGPFEVDYERRADKFLGKSVRSQGESIRLERWHLDCVDAFKAEIGGWDEAALAKRLVSLMLGEERRSRRAAAKPVFMFH